MLSVSGVASSFSYRCHFETKPVIRPRSVTGPARLGLLETSREKRDDFSRTTSEFRPFLFFARRDYRACCKGDMCSGEISSSLHTLGAL